jgi:hypothetical protein
MSIGTSGRIVIELDPGLKRQVYSALAKDGMTLKEWFVKEAQNYIKTTSNDQLDIPSDPSQTAALQTS